MIELDEMVPSGTEGHTQWDEYPDWAWERPSLAVVACDGNGHGAVLWTAGPHVNAEIKDVCLRELNGLGLDDAPLGISVWEGVYTVTYTPASPNGPEECDGSFPSGSFRAPTADEWQAIMANRCPWDDKDWRVRKEPEAN